MNYNITHQENYSRGELLLRALFGWLYIALPHGFILVFLGLWSLILTFIAWWVVLFNGVYPRSFYSYQEKMQRWAARLNARFFNLADGYPAFGLDAKDDKVIVEIPYPERLGRGHLLLRTFFGFFYCILPHGFILIFRQLATMVLAFLAFWVVLFTGKYPEGWHEFNVGTLRWNFRLNLYLNFMTDDYPPFSGKPDIKFKRVG
jgi:hypothetical protein